MDFKALIAAPLIAAVALANPSDFVKPKGWSYSSTGSAPGVYRIGVDPQVKHMGRPALSVRSESQQTQVDAGMALQYAQGYRGKRVRLSANVRVAAADGWGGLLLQAGGEAIRFIDAAEIPFGAGGRGNADWAPMSVVVDVPSDAKSVSMGLVLVGNGQVWASDMKFEVVDAAVPLTLDRIGIDAKALASVQQERRERAVQNDAPPANLTLDLE
jgi:hypothetical protein